MHEHNWLAILIEQRIAGMDNWRPAGRIRPTYFFYLARATF